MSAWAIVAAAGRGTRLRGSRTEGKAFIPLGGKPMVAYSLAAFAKASHVDGVVLVVPAGREGSARAVADEAVPSLRVEIVPGGTTRQASVNAGLSLIPVEVDRVIVHDAARPLVTPSLIEITLSALAHTPGVVMAIPESDTLKKEKDGRVVATIEREGIWRAQTPQAFRTAVLRAAHARAASERHEVTDDAALLEWIGETVAIVKGSHRNMKVTTSEDLALVEAILSGEGNG
jgi:2-C-methyl-D-erythritol 4-phosphate cytidylyltransferase